MRTPSRSPPSQVEMYKSPCRRASLGLRPLSTHRLLRMMLFVVVCLPDHLIDEREPWWYPAWRHMRFLLNRSDLALRYYNCLDTFILPAGSTRYAFPDAVDEAALRQFPIYTQFLASSQANRTQLPDRLGTLLKADPTTVLDQQLRTAAQSSVKLDGSNDSAALPIDFDGKVDFLGYTLSQEGKNAELVTYWRVKDQLPSQVSQFTHILNVSGDIVTQADRLMLTSQSLRVGDVVAQIQRLTLPENLGAGSYRIAIGLYTQPDGKRLPVLENGQPRGDRLFLQSIAVK